MSMTSINFAKLLNDPAQSIIPFTGLSIAESILRMSWAVDTTLGRPNNENGESSGCIYKSTPFCSATNKIFCKKANKFSLWPCSPSSINSAIAALIDSCVYDPSPQDGPAIIFYSSKLICASFIVLKLAYACTISVSP